MLYTPDEAAEALNLKPPMVVNPKRIVLKMARRGELESRRVSKFTMITVQSVEKFLNLGQLEAKAT